MLKIVLNILLYLVFSQAVYSQSISLSKINNINFPEMTGELLILDEKAEAIPNITREDLSLSRAGSELTILDITCPPPRKALSISSVLMIDISGSMLGEGKAIAKRAATKWIELLDIGQSECAIGSFNSRNHFVQDFTNDRNILLASIQDQNVYGGTDFNAAFINPPASALEIVGKGRYKKVVVLLTDGYAEGDEQEIIRRANEINAVIYCVVLNEQAPDILKNISTATGGNYFDRITNAEEAENTFMQILFLARGGEACQISWLENNCVSSDIIDVKYNSLKASTYAPIESNRIARFEISDNAFLNFIDAEPGKTITQKITITARNQDIAVAKILVTNVLFRISDYGGSLPPFIISKDKSRELNIEFTPKDSLQVFSNFAIYSDACINNFFFASGGYNGKLPDQKYIKVTYPNGGEKFATKQEVEIRWEGVANDDPVDVEFSSNSGLIWVNVGTSKGNEPLKWETPLEESGNCLIRISQNYDDKTNKVVYRNHNSKVNSVSWSDDNKQVASGSELLQVHIWNPLTGSSVEKSDQFMFYDKSFDWSKNLIASCDYQKGINIWNVENDTILRPLKNSSQKFSNIEFSTNALNIIASEDKYNTPDVLLWDLKTGELKYSFNGHAAQINDIAWSPNSFHFASCDINSKIFVWSKFEKNFISNFKKDDKSSALSVEFNNTGTKLICSYSDSSLIVWEPLTGKNLDSTSITGELVNCIDWGKDGLTLAAGCESGAVYQIRYFSGNFQFELIGRHNSAVNDIELSDDASRILSGSNDSTAIVWYLHGIRLSDKSDSLFAIIQPELETKSIDFGYSYIGRRKDSTVQTFIRNIKDIAIRIDSIYIEDQNVFNLSSTVDGMVLQPNKEINVQFSFKPLSAIIYTSPIYIYSGKEIFTSSISGEGVAHRFLSENITLNFGKVLIKEDKLLAFTASNNSPNDIELLEPEFLGPDRSQFSISYEANLNLHSGDDLRFEVTFAPTEIGRTSTDIEIKEANSTLSYYITCYGEGITKPGSASIKINNAFASSGEVIQLEIELQNKQNFAINQVQYVYADLSFNKTLLVPTDGSGIIIDTDRKYPIKIEVDNKNEQVEFIEFLATLGEVSSTDITIDTVWADRGNIEFEVENGRFTLLDICDTGEQRLVRSTGTYKFELSQSDEYLNLSFSLIEKSEVRIEIIDINGELKSIIDLQYLSLGSYKYEYNLKELPNGIYFCKLISATGILFEKFLNIK